jgi:hypothetical protein
MNYIKYIKLNGEQEYKISDDGTTLLNRHKPSQGSDSWYTTTVSSRNKILSLRANYTGNNVECLLEDEKWYHIGSHGGLTLTVDELNKKHNDETKDDSSKSSFSLFGKKKDNKKDDSKVDSLNTFGNEIDDDEIDDELLGDDFYEKELNKQLTILLGLYKSQKATGSQVVDMMDHIFEDHYSYFEIDSYFEEFENEFEDSFDAINIKEWVEKFIQKFPPVYENKYPELKDHSFIIDDSAIIVESKGLFDLSSKLKNKKIDQLKNDRKEASHNLALHLEGLRVNLIRVEEDVRDFIKYQKEKSQLEKKGVSKGIGFLSLLDGNSEEAKQKKRDKGRLEFLEKELKTLQKETIIKHNKLVKDNYDEIVDIVKKLKKLHSELFKATNAPIYKNDIKIEGEGMELAKKISANVKKTDVAFFKKLFGIK